MHTEKHVSFLNHRNAGILNRNAVLNYIKSNAPVSRTEIWEKMSMSRASVTQIIKQLMQEGMVVEKGVGKSNGGGRKPSFLCLKEGAKNIIAFDWHKKTLYLTELNGAPVDSVRLDISCDIEPIGLVRTINDGICRIIERTGINADDVLGLGLIMPGFIDVKRGAIIYSAEQGWENVDLKDMLEKEIKIRTLIESDGNMNVLGEYLSEYNYRYRNIVIFEIEKSGMGLGIVLNGRIIRGSNSMAGEIGYMRLLNNNISKPFTKGNDYLVTKIRELLDNKKGNWKIELAEHVGKAAAITVNILDPDLIVFSGEVMDELEEDVFCLIESIMRSSVINREHREVEVRRARFGAETCLKGMCERIYNMNYSCI